MPGSDRRGRDEERRIAAALERLRTRSVDESVRELESRLAESTRSIDALSEAMQRRSEALAGAEVVSDWVGRRERLNRLDAAKRALEAQQEEINLLRQMLAEVKGQIPRPSRKLRFKRED